MSKWLRALAPLALTAIALIFFFTGDRTLAMLLIVAALATAFLTGTGILGRPTTTRVGKINPKDVRSYRQAHPNTTISEAVTAVSDMSRS
jgi:hypothetical protein